MPTTRAALIAATLTVLNLVLERMPTDNCQRRLKTDPAPVHLMTRNMNIGHAGPEQPFSLDLLP